MNTMLNHIVARLARKPQTPARTPQAMKVLPSRLLHVVGGGALKWGVRNPNP